ncbi:MAG: cyclic nucleotide-binding domain-containing protein [Bacteroidia bacterium]|nr:cyclic nucleotide-binding domain-containing protein [Bacteroidia bacterium]
MEHTRDSLTELEKIIVLKSTALFSDTPENVIAEIGAIVEEVIVPKDELIFSKGDPGSSMYIIHNGEIRIHDSDKTFAVLQNLDFFGELALLDPEPRSASATATKDSLLMKINQEAAYELMEDRTEVLKSMMTILCRRIRIQNDKLAMAIDAQNS